MIKKLKVTDYIIIFFLIIVMIIGFCVFKKKNFANLPIEKETKIMFDVIFRGVSISGKAAPFRVGDEAFITIRNVPYTKLKIIGVDGSPRLTYVPSKNKEGYKVIEDVSAPGVFDIIVRLEDNAKKTSDGYVAGGNKIKMGIPVVIEGQLYRYQGTISNIFEVQENEQ